MEPTENHTLVLHPDSNCSLLNNLLENINQYVLRVHEHCLGSVLFPEASTGKDSGECRLCAATVDGIPLRGKRSRTYGVELAEDAHEYHQGDDRRSQKVVCSCSPGNNIFVKINNNDKEIIEWFRKTHAERSPRGSSASKKTTSPKPVKAPFTARVTNKSTATSDKENIRLDVSVQRIPEKRRVSFQDDVIDTTSRPPTKSANKPSRSWTRPVLAEIVNVFKRMANMLSCGRGCQCKPQHEKGGHGAEEEHDAKTTISRGSMTNLVMTVDSNSGEKFVGLSSWDTNKDTPVFLMMTDSTEFDERNANDIVEILRNRSLLSSSTTTYDIFSRDQGTSKRHE